VYNAVLGPFAVTWGDIFKEDIFKGAAGSERRAKCCSLDGAGMLESVLSIQCFFLSGGPEGFASAQTRRLLFLSKP
jgi:hypothetical protein